MPNSSCKGGICLLPVETVEAGSTMIAANRRLTAYSSTSREHCLRSQTKSTGNKGAERDSGNESTAAEEVSMMMDDGCSRQPVWLHNLLSSTAIIAGGCLRCQVAERCAAGKPSIFGSKHECQHYLIHDQLMCTDYDCDQDFDYD